MASKYLLRASSKLARELEISNEGRKKDQVSSIKVEGIQSAKPADESLNLNNAEKKPASKFDEKAFDGLRDEDREKTEYLDEEENDDPIGGTSNKTANPLSKDDLAGQYEQDRTQEIERANMIVKHFCAECNVDQPIRAKHCHKCGICVATFDHHCIWVGNCVGEKNRPLFFYFLHIQLFELLYMYYMVGSKVLAKLQPADLISSLPLLSAIHLAYFFIIIGILSLTVYHYRFMCTNITTWEYVSWPEITYLDGFRESEGSPFSVSLMGNILSYFTPSRTTFYDWVPVKAPRGSK